MDTGGQFSKREQLGLKGDYSFWQQVFLKHLQCNHPWCNSSARTASVCMFQRVNTLYMS